MDSDSIRQFIGLIILLGFSAFFSSSETALTSLNKIRLRAMVEAGIKGAKAVGRVTEDSDKLLSSILIGNNLVNVACSTIAASLAINLSKNDGKYLWLSTILVTALLLIFGEITPKTLAAQNPERVSLAVARPIGFFKTVLTPVAWILNGITRFVVKALGGGRDGKKTTITESELKTLVEVGHKEGVIHVDEKKMINNIFDFGDSHARDIMTPRTDMVALPNDASYDDVMEVFKSERYSRLPVYKEDADHIVGVLYLKDFIFSDIDKDHFKIEHYLRDTYFSYESKLTNELFAEMRRDNMHLAIILDEYGGTSGIVTIEDLVEEIVGDIFDLDDEEEQEEIRLVGEGEYDVEASVKINDFNELAGTELESEDYESLGGYVLGLFGRIPTAGESVDEGKLRFHVKEADKSRIMRLQIIISPLPDKEEGDKEERQGILQRFRRDKEEEQQGGS